MSVVIRPALPGDAEVVAAIYADAIEAGGATFRTDPVPAHELAGLITTHPVFLVATRDGRIVGWAGVGPYEATNPSYEGVGEVAIYVDKDARSQGIGSPLLSELSDAAKDAGLYKLVAKVFDTNTTSLALFERCGYRTVGTHLRHGRLRGEWKDVVVLEKLLG